MSTYRVTLSTPNSSVAYSGLSFKVTLPTGLTVAQGAATPSCGHSTITGANPSTLPQPGDGYFTWSGRFAANEPSICVVSVPVTATGATSYRVNPNSFSQINGLTAPSSAAVLAVSAHSSDQPDWGLCPSAGFLFQNATADAKKPSQVVSFSLEPGTNAQQSNLGWTQDYVNAVGFNQVDGYMWGWDVSDNELVRIGSDMSLDEFPLAAGTGLAGLAGNVPSSGGYNIGDVSPEGKMYLSSDHLDGNKQDFAVIDLTNTTNGVLDPLVTRISTLSGASPASMADWAYDKLPGAAGNDGALWGVGYSGSDPYLFQISATGTVTPFADLKDTASTDGITDSAAGNNSFGADYIDSNNNLYVSNNVSGNIYKIPLGYGQNNTLSHMSTYVSGGPQATGNDGARCSSAPVTPPTLTLQKVVANGAVASASDQFAITIGDVTTGTTRASAQTATPPASPTAASTTITGTETDTYSFSESAAAGALLSNYTTAFVCIDQTTRATLSPTQISTYSYTLTPQDGQQVLCTFTNTAQQPTISASKIVSSLYKPTDQFQLSVTSQGTLVPGPNNPATTTIGQTGRGPQANIGPLNVFAGRQYTVAEAAVSGDLNNYLESYACVDLNDNSSIVAGDGPSVTFTVPQKATPANVSCTYVNTAKGTPAEGVVDIIKTTPNQQVTPGGEVDYTVRVSNTGLVDESGVGVNDPIPAGLASFDSWTCNPKPNSNATCVSGSATRSKTAAGAISNESVDLPVGSYVTYSIAATADELLPQTVTNTATVVPPAEVSCTDNGVADATCSASVTRPTAPVISLKKQVVSRANGTDQFVLGVSGGDLSSPSTVVTSGPATGLQTAFVGPVLASSGTTYTISEAGDGLTDLSQYDQDYSCTDQANAPGVVFASGALSNGQASVTVPSGTTYQPDVVCTLTNTAIAPTISVTKSESSNTIVPGGTITYTVTVTNTSTVAADGSTLVDPIPNGISGVTAWSCVGSSTTGGSVLPCPSSQAPSGALISDTYGAFPAGQVFTYTITAQGVDALPPIVTNVATATPPSNGFCTSVSGTGAVGADCSASVTATSDIPTVSVQKNIASYFDVTDQFRVSVSPTGGSTLGSATTTPGTTGEQALAGPYSATAAASYTVAETPIAGVGTLANYHTTVACVDTANGNAPVLAPMLPDSSGTRSATVQIPTDVPAAAHVLCTFQNTALFSQVGIQKVLTDPSQKLTPGGQVDYTVTITNTGTIDAGGTIVNDPIPSGIRSFDRWTCDPSGGAICPVDTTIIPGSNAISNQQIATFPAGSSLTYRITATAVLFGLPGSVTNHATADPPLHGSCQDGSAPPCAAQVTIDSSPVISLSKTVDGRVNTGDQFTISLIGDSVSATATTSGAGTGADQAVINSQAAVAGSTYTLSETGAAGADLSQYTSTYTCTDTANTVVLASGTLTPTAPQGQVTIPTSSAQVPEVSCVIDNTPDTPLVSITKSSNSTLTPNGQVVYTVTVSNSGTVPADGSEFTDQKPDGIAEFDSWDCTAKLLGTTCPQAGFTGPGNIDQTFASFPVGQVFTYTIYATAAATFNSGAVTNTAYIAPPVGGGCSDGTTPPCKAEVTLPLGSQPTIMAKKFVQSVATPTDQFALNITGGAINNSVNTTPGATGYWTLGPFAADTTSTYTVSETALSGTLLDYSTNYYCSNLLVRGSILAQGSGTSVSLQLPSGIPQVRCDFINTALPQTITVKKNVVSYYSSADQFSVRVDGFGVVSNNSAVTTLNQTGIAAATPAVPVTAGYNYTIAETAVVGNLADYMTSYQCVDSANTVVKAGLDASSFSLTMPAAVPPAQITCTFTNTARPTISVVKATTTPFIVPAGHVAYTVTVTNTSPSLGADGTTVADPAPPGIDHFATWRCDAYHGAMCPTVSGSGDLSTQTIATFPAGSWVTYTIDAIAVVSPAIPGTNPSVTNTATANPPTGGKCTVTGGLSAPPCPASVTTPVVQPTVTVQKNVVSYFAPTDQFQTRITGALIAGNNSATTTIGQLGTQAKVSPALQAIALTQYHATETAVSGNLANYTASYSCRDTANGSGNVPTSQDGTGYGVTFIVPTGLNAANVVCTVTNTARTPSVGIAKSVIESIAVPGGSIHYEVLVTNPGPSDANGTRVQDAPPAGIDSFTAVTCSPAGDALCPTNLPAGAIDQTIATLPALGSLTFHITAKVSLTATGSIVNTAYVTPPHNGTCSNVTEVAGRCPATASIGVDQPTVSIQKNVVSYYAAGDQFQVSVGGAGITANNTVTTVVGHTGIVGLASPLSALPGSLYTVTETALGTTDPDDYVTSHQCVDTANGNSVVPSSSGLRSFTVTMTTPTTAAAKVVCTFINTAKPSIALTKTTSNTDIQPGGAVSYQLTVTGTSLVPAVQPVIDDKVPTTMGIQSFTGWICHADDGALCGNGLTSETGAAGELYDKPTTIPLGGHVVYSISAIATSPPLPSVTNTATAAPVSPGFCSTTGAAVCTASITISPLPVISIVKTADLASVKPNDTIHYEVVVSNVGVQPTSTVEVTDPKPDGLTAFTNVVCVSATWGAVCPTVAPSGPLDAIIGSFPVGASVTFRITATVSANPPANITNVATAIPLESVTCTTSPCTSTVITPSVPIVSVSKIADLTGVIPGSQIVYTVTASNVGTVAADGSKLDDVVPTGLTNSIWTCAPRGNGGAVCPQLSGSGDIHQTIATMPAGSVLVYRVTATVDSNPPSPIVNEVTFDPPYGGLCADPGYPPICDRTVPVPVLPQVSVTKTADRSVIVPNGPVNYTVTIANTGQVDAGGSVLVDPIPTGLTNVSWTCTTASGNAVCPTGSGTSGLDETIAVFPVGSSLAYDVNATVSANPPSLITNTATLTPPPNGLCSPTNAVGPCIATVALPGVLLAFTGVAVAGVIQFAVASIIGGGIVLIILALRRRRRPPLHAAR